MSMQTELSMMDMYRSFAGTKKPYREIELVVMRNDKKNIRSESEPDTEPSRKRKLPWYR